MWKEIEIQPIFGANKEEKDPCIEIIFRVHQHQHSCFGFHSIRSAVVASTAAAVCLVGVWVTCFSWAGVPDGRLRGRRPLLWRSVLQQPPEARQPQQQQQEQQHREPEGESVTVATTLRDHHDDAAAAQPLREH